ncbi:MAG: hypothetical protein WD275_04265 [Rhodothermales bacterium]
MIVCASGRYFLNIYGKPRKIIVTVIRPHDRVKFLLERWLQRGVRTQLLFIGAVIASVAILGGVIAWIFSSQFDHPAAASASNGSS